MKVYACGRDQVYTCVYWYVCLSIGMDLVCNSVCMSEGMWTWICCCMLLYVRVFYEYVICGYVNVRVSTSSSVRLWKCMWGGMSVFLSIFSVYASVCTYVSLSAWMCAWMRVWMYVQICVWDCVYMCAVCWCMCLGVCISVRVHAEFVCEHWWDCMCV